MAIPSTTAGRNQSVAARGLTKSVLLIEDDRGLRALIAEYLDTQGWTVLQADDGQTGLALARENRPAVVVCDLLLPRMNGFQICHALRNEHSLRQTRILAISGRGYAANQQMALEAGAHDFLAKPIKLSDLQQTLDRLIAEPGRVPETAFLTGDAAATLVKFWGVRGSVPVPGPSTVEYGGNTSCIEVRADGEIIILDCGTGARALGRKLADEFKDKPLDLTLLISHTHWDHIQGFPFFLPAYDSKNRIQILGYEGACDGLAGVLAGQMESPYFPISLKELPSNLVIKELKDLQFNVGSIKVKAAFMNHPGICMGYRLFTSGGSIAYLPDNEPFQRPETSTETADAPRSEDISYAQSEDAKLIEFIQDVDLLIMDAQYDAEEYKSHIGWGHGCVDEVVRLALRARVKRLLLFHHDPNHDDRKVAAMTEHARAMVASSRSDMIVESARELSEYRFNAELSKADRNGHTRLLRKPLLR